VSTTALIARPARADSLDCVRALVAKVENLATHGRARFVAETSARIDATAAQRVTQELKDLLGEVLPEAERGSGKMSAAQFNQAVARLKAAATSYGITVAEGSGMTGVYPKGLDKIELVFGAAGAMGPDFGLQHELAHMFHTIQTRAILLQSVRAGSLSVADAEAYLKIIESGANYREFEKAVTATSGLATSLTGREGSARYVDRVSRLLDGTEEGLQAGRIRFPNGRTFEDVYALFLSKAPLVVGTSGTSLALRMPAIWFATFYALNLDVSGLGIDPRKAGVELRAGHRGFRDLVDALIAKYAGLS
jgi:hypothetical protein